MNINRVDKIQWALLVAVVLTITACQKSSNDTSTSDSANSGPFVPIHTPLTHTSPPHNFYNGGVLPDGRVWGYGVFDATDHSRLFIASPDSASFAQLAPDDVGDAIFAPKVERAIYLKDGALFSAASATETIKISGSQAVARYWLSPDETKVAFIANVKYELVYYESEKRYIYTERNELFVADVVSGHPVKVSPDIAGSMVAYEYYASSVGSNNHARPRILPDNSRILFVLTRDAQISSELYSVRLDGGDKRLLSATVPINAHESVGDAAFAFDSSLDSKYVIYIDGSAQSPTLHSVSAAGANDVVLGSVAARCIGAYYERSGFCATVAPDNQRVLFIADAEVKGQYHYYSVSIQGGAPVEVTGGKQVYSGAAPYFFEDNGIHMLFVSDGLYRVPLSGNAPVALNPADTSGGLSDFTIVPGGDFVVYKKYQDTTGNQQLLATKLNGTKTVSLYTPPADARYLQLSACAPNRMGYMIDPISKRIAYCANGWNDNGDGIYIVDANGENATKLSPDRVQPGSARKGIFGFVGNDFYFSFERDSLMSTELYKYDFSAKIAKNLSVVWPSFVTEDVSYMQQSANGSAEIAVIEGVGSRKTAILAMSNSLGTSCRIEVSSDESIVSMNSNLFPSYDGKSLFFTLNYRNNKPWRFFKASSEDCGTTELDTSLADYRRRMKLTLNGKTIVYSGGKTGRRFGEVYAINVDNTQPRLLTKNVSDGGGVPNLNVGAFGIAPDNSRVVFWSDQQTVGVTEFYSVALDGTGEVKLNGTLQPDTSVFVDDAFEAPISSDSKWVLYFAAQDHSYLEPYVSRLDGSAHIKLTEGLTDVAADTGNFSVTARFTPDAKYVVFMGTNATQRSGADIYAVALNGGTPVKLNPTPGADGGVVGYSELQFKVSPSSDRILYAFQQSNVDPVELYAANLTGVNIVKVNITLPTSAEVSAFAFNSDQSRAVYRVYDSDLNSIALYSSKLDGTGHVHLADLANNDWGSAYDSPILVTQDNRVIELVRGGSGSKVVAIRVGDGVTTTVATLGSARVKQMTLSPDGTQVFVIGDLREKGVNEVFRFEL